MIDKQIINVSDCNYHNNGKCTNSAIGQCNCANVVSCYYKEYKRKEQECEELKAKFVLFKTSNQATIDQLKAENERLSEEREKAKNYNLEYGQLLIKATNKNNKLKQTLAEIKDIAEKNNKTEEELFKIRHSRLTKVSMGALTGRCNLAKEILQKINEVE
jgi:hypothetical protein